ncbi:hypothetical protein GUITHDRAFT_115849 [Guillardia theta CCMP2712]|uniref:Serine hydrolase domain-containing protein n=1 Tax=Guillardia theta (strain CCMP2712) TaxID=905079 RepID=L1IPR3_GUITC|nr:hypothetical protein GUITHDRAFT_115849 [Guillardia theta CCMP2712]EKX38087.1 hypothetical protein GUITHDRAFT_115849 [Guillardia theta CCMP2712]|eukprot:XP_005825067.1 hypothetical protein GUITHDRAFT_115849 [Guillardia theta CCMP2712]
MFRSKTGSLRKRLKNVHFEFVDPPFTSKHESIGEGLSWYEFSTVGEDEVKWSRFDESLQYISEGACVAALLSVLRERDSLPPPVQFQFVWLFSGFCPKDPEWRKLCLETQVARVRKISSVHVIGETDQIISPQRSTEAAGIFTDSVIIRHEKGHLVPSDKKISDGLLSFLEAHTS